nr:MAG TPA: G-protein interacting protein 1 helix, lipid binding, G-protein [Caudoviricetes sp.]
MNIKCNLILENAFCTKNLIKINVKVYFMYNKQTED